MSFITANSFVFNGKNSDDYNLKIAWIDSSDIDVSENGLDLTLEKTSNKVNYTTNIYGIQSENIIFNFGVVKKDYSKITRMQSIQINEWLTSSSNSQFLAFNDGDSYPLHYYAVCTQIEDIIVGGELVGKNLRLETNSPFAFSKKMEKKVEITDTHQFYINNTSNANDNIIYPKITIITQSATITIENSTDKKSVTINTDDIPVSSDGNKHIKLDSYNMTISDKNNELIPAYKLGWNNTYRSFVSVINDYITNIYWVRFIKGINKIKITGNCNITIEYESPRKAGCL